MSSGRGGIVVAAIALLAVAGCAGLPARPPLAPTHAVAATDAAATTLGRIATASLRPGASGAESGFRLEPQGDFALDARIALIRRAEKSIDAQYYLIADDGAGRLLLRELAAAADRGVRVRLVVDDFYAAGEDELFAGLAAHANAEVRIFNPLPARGGSTEARLFFSLHAFGRINHRMHNKLLVVDGSFAVSGGRNIADEYFMQGLDTNFVDMDLVSCGPVVRELEGVFDRYWNSEAVYPIGALRPDAPHDAAAARQRFDERTRDGSAYAAAVDVDVFGRAPLSQELAQTKLPLVWAPSRVLADTPAKVAGIVADGAAGETESDTVTEQTVALFLKAQKSVEIASPYLIPGKSGLAEMTSAARRGGIVTLITNSFGSTDEPLAYAKYARYRLELLQSGVTIYELSPSLARQSRRLGNFGRSQSRLHAKVSVIDRETAIIGSMNLDARSAYSNTEIVTVIESPELCEAIASLVRNDIVYSAYRLRLAPDGRHIQWVETALGGRETVHDEEPDNDRWLRFKLWLVSPFVGEALL